MNMHHWIQSILRAKTRTALPIMTSPGMEMIGSTPREVFQSGELQYRSIKALAEQTPSAAAVTMMDLSVEAEAFGSPIAYSDRENPTVTDRILRDAADIGNLIVPSPGAARTGEALRAARLCAQNITDRPVLAGMIGPFSLAGRLFDMTEMMMLCGSEPECAHALLRKTTDFLLAYGRAFKATNVGGIIIAEPAAGLLSPEMSAEFAAQYVREIVAALQDETFIVMLHNCGNTVRQIPDWLRTGVAALHVGNAVKMTDIWPQIPPNVLILGNLDPVGVFKNGSAEAIRTAALALLEEGKNYPNYVLSSGCDVPPGTSLRNVQTFYDALTEYNMRQG